MENITSRTTTKLRETITLDIVAIKNAIVLIEGQLLQNKLADLLNKCTKKATAFNNHALNNEVFCKQRDMHIQMLQDEAKEISISDELSEDDKSIALDQILPDLIFPFWCCRPFLKTETENEQAQNITKEQQLFNEQKAIRTQLTFMQALSQLKEDRKTKQSRKPKFYFMYAWPVYLYAQRESEIQNFLENLRQDLLYAGVEAIFDREDNFSGNNLNQFIGQILHEHAIVLVFGTESFRHKWFGHKTALQVEGELLKLKWLTDFSERSIQPNQRTTIIPFVLTGIRETAIPEDLLPAKNLTVRTLYNLSYQQIISSLLAVAYGITDQAVAKYINNIQLQIIFNDPSHSRPTNYSAVQPQTFFGHENHPPNDKDDFLDKEITKDKIPLIWNTPNENIHFVGRTKELHKLEQYFLNCTYSLFAQVITGLSGIGKTQLVKKYVYLNKHKYDIIWWINFKNGLDTEYYRLAYELKNKLRLNVSLKNFKTYQICEFVKNTLRQDINWLLIIDDVFDEKQVLDYLPQQHDKNKYGHIILTSQNPYWNQVNRLALSSFTDEEVNQLLKSIINDKNKIFSKEQNNSINELAKQMGYLPLALAQAGAYINENFITINEYIEQFKKHLYTLWPNEEPANDYDKKRTLAITLSITINNIVKDYPLIKTILNYCAYLGNQIQIKLLKRILQIDNKGLIQFNAALKKLSSYSIIEYFDSDQEVSDFFSDFYANCYNERSFLEYFEFKDVIGHKSLYIHPLIQLVVKQDIENKNEIFITLIKYFYQKFKYSLLTSRKQLLLNKSLMPHIKNVVNHIKDELVNVSSIKDELIKLILDISSYHYFEISDNTTALSMLDIANTIYKINKDQIKPLNKVLLNLHRGNAYFNQSNYEFAQGFYMKSLTLLKYISKNTPEYDKYIAVLYHQIGNTYSKQKYHDYKKAFEFYNKSLQLNEKIFKNEPHPHIANNYHELAYIYAVDEDLKDFDKALRLIKVSIAMKVFFYDTEEHPDVAITYDMWGQIYQYHNSYLYAKSKYQKALNLYEKTYGINHEEYKNTKYRLEEIKIKINELNLNENNQNLNDDDALKQMILKVEEFSNKGRYEKKIKIYNDGLKLKYEDQPRIVTLAFTLERHESHLIEYNFESPSINTDLNAERDSEDSAKENASYRRI